MTDLGAARRLYRAIRVAAQDAGLGEVVPQLLMRFGYPGLMARAKVEPPAPVDEALFRLQQLRHSILLEHAGEVATALTQSGTEHFFAKGIALLGTVYQPGDRLMADMDLYIRIDHRGAVLGVLGGLGYRPRAEHEQAGPAALRSSLALEREAAHDIERTAIDLHWALDPVERVLPRRDRPVPARMWDHLVRTGDLHTPMAEHHAAILVHHLVHTDLLHVRSLLDLAFVFAEVPEDGGAEYLAVCRQLRIERTGISVAGLLAKEFGVARPAAIAGQDLPRNRWIDQLTLEGWLGVVARSEPDDDNAITVRRLRRRLQLIDRPAWRTLGQDVFFPPAAFLHWRWGTDDLGGARRKHYGQLLRKALRKT